MGGATVFVAVLGLAAALGYGAGDWFGEKRYAKDRLALTETVVKQMGTINVGDTLPDHLFEDLSRNPTRLSELVNSPTLVTFVSPTCPSCEAQLNSFIQNVPEESQQSGYVIISPHNPRFLEEFRDSLGVRAPLLYDHRRAYWKTLNIRSFPLNVYVDKNLVITDMIVGEIDMGEIR